MIFFRKKQPAKTLPPKPVWLKWALLAFIGYVLFMASLPHENDTKKAVTKAKQQVEQQMDFEGYKEKIFPQHAAGLRTQEVKEGTGAPAVCGQTVRVAYQTYLAQGNELPDAATKEKPLSFTIGAGKTMPVFEQGVVGMKPDGQRSVIAPPLMSYGLEDYRREDVPQGASVRFEMELLSAEPALPPLEKMPYRIAEVAPGRGQPVVCGEPANVRVTIWDLRGKELYSNAREEKLLAFTPGHAEVMLGLEHGVIGMQAGGTRLLIIPPAFQSGPAGKKPATNFPLPANETVMVEVVAE